jgi:hypothetical protein
MSWKRRLYAKRLQKWHEYAEKPPRTTIMLNRPEINPKSKGHDQGRLGQAYTYIKRYAGRGDRQCGVYCLTHGALVRSAGFLCAVTGHGERCEAGAWHGGEAVVGRPQGPRGHDHPTKVQQRRTQTDTLFFCTPGAIVTLLVSQTNYKIARYGVI